MAETTQVVPIAIHAKQAEFRQSTSRVRGFAAGVGAGKTVIGAMDLLKRARDGRHYMVLAPNHRMLRDAAWVTFQDVAKSLGRVESERRSAPMEDIILTENGGRATVLFRSADEPEHIRGPNLSGIWIDEAAVMLEEAYLVALGRLREGGSLGWLTMTFTPKGKAHWTYGVFFDGDVPRSDTHLVTAHTLDNPFVEEEFHDALASRYSEQRARQELAGEFIDMGSGTVNRAMFGDPLRIAPECVRVCRAWDKAGTAGGKGACTAGVKIGLTKDGKYVVLHVVRGRWNAIDREREIKQTAEIDANENSTMMTIIIEQEPGSGGKESCEATILNLAGHDVHAFKPGGKGSKIERVDPFIAQIQAGNVTLVAGDWNRTYLDEWSAFPDGLMDQVDASGMAFMQVSRRGQGLIVDRPLIIDLPFDRPIKIADEFIVAGRRLSEQTMREKLTDEEHEPSDDEVRHALRDSEISSFVEAMDD